MIEQYVDAAELKRLLSGLLVVIGVIMLAALFGFLVVPGMRNANKPAAPPVSASPQTQTGWLDLTEYPPRKGYDIPPVDPKTILSASPQVLEKGRALFQTNCAACHGPGGQGDGPAAQGLNPKPRNFASPAAWVNGYTLPGICKTLAEGIKGTGMAAFDTLTPVDRVTLAHYVQSLGAFPHGDDPKALEAFGEQFARAGARVPGKIPVSEAMARLESENPAPPPLRVPPQDDRSRSAELMRQAVADPALAAQTLGSSPAWKAGPEALAGVIVPGTPGNGFDPAVADLSPERWRQLLEELQKESGR